MDSSRSPKFDINGRMWARRVQAREDGPSRSDGCASRMQVDQSRTREQPWMPTGASRS